MTTVLPDPSQLSTQVLGAAAAIAVAVALWLRMSVATLRRELAELSLERADLATTLLPQNAIPLRMEPELAWAELERQPYAVIVFHVHGTAPEPAARALREGMRGEENAYLLRPQRFCVGLWKADEDAAARAAQRLGQQIVAGGGAMVEAGVATYPGDSRDLEELIEIAQQGLRPLDQQLPPRESDQPRRLHTPAGRFARLVRSTLPAFAAAAAAVAFAHLAYPRALSAGAQLDGGQAAAALGLLGVVAALLAAAAWMTFNRGAPGEPQSAGGALSPVLVAGTAVAAAALLAWAVVAPDVPRAAPLFGAMVVYDALLVLVACQARFLVRADATPLVLVTLLGGAMVAGGLDGLPQIANAGRLVVAIGIGCLLARAMERVSWMIVLALTISLVDSWSVLSEAGPTRRLAASDSAVLDALLYLGPSVDGRALYAVGTSDLSFAVAFLAVAHFWRLEVRVLAIALVGGFACAGAASAASSQLVPVLPFLSAAFLLVSWRALAAELGIGPGAGAAGGDGTGAAEGLGTGAAGGGDSQGQPAAGDHGPAAHAEPAAPSVTATDDTKAMLSQA